MADKKISALTAASTPLAGTEVLPIVQSGSTVKVSVNNLTAGKSVSMKDFTANSGAANQECRLQYSDNTGGRTVILRMSSSSLAPFDGYGAYIKATQGGGVDVHSLAFGTTIGTPSDKLSIRYDGLVTVETDNLKIGTAGKGIDFSANTHAAGMTSELLNWYEEGAWTPSVGGDATYTIQEGYYVRVGDLVYVQCQLLLNVLGTGSTTTISGLPFQAFSPSNSSRGTGSIWYCGNLATNVTSIVPGVTPAGQTITFGGFTAAGASMSVPLTVFQNGTRVDFSLVYRAN